MSGDGASLEHMLNLHLLVCLFVCLFDTLLGLLSCKSNPESLL